MKAPGLREVRWDDPKETKKGRPKPTNAETRDDLRRLIPALVANAADFPHLEAPRLELVSIVDHLEDLLAQQATMAAAKQEASKKQQELIDKGRQLATFVRAGVKQRYGRRSEKLAEFNIQPFRGRKPAPEPDTPEEPDDPNPPSTTE